jgi:hypothetical protein
MNPHLSRRDLLRGGALGAAGLALSMPNLSMLGQATPTLQLEYAANFEIALDAPQVVGQTPDGLRQIVYVSGGTASGPLINGTFLPGGGDWVRVRSDGVFVLDVRVTLELDDGHLAFSHYPGYGVISQEQYGRILGGEEVDATEYYLRTTPRFETDSEQYAWLNHTLFVATAKLAPGIAGVTYELFRVL